MTAIGPIAGGRTANVRIRDKAVAACLQFVASKQTFSFDHDQDRKAALRVISFMSVADSRRLVADHRCEHVTGSSRPSAVIPHLYPDQKADSRLSCAPATRSDAHCPLISDAAFALSAPLGLQW